MTPPALPLQGYRIVELTHQLIGPLAGVHLADFGADVIKVEPLAGDSRRKLGPSTPAGISQQFLAINRNKRSVSVNLRAASGREVLERLLASADVLLTNYTADALRALKLDEKALEARHPDLIVCSLTAFGSTGPQAHRRGFDINVCGEMGLLLQDAQGAPRSNAAPFADTGGALMLAYGVALALLHRERGGRAQRVETSLTSICVALMADRFLWLDGAPAPDLSPALRPSKLYALYGAYPTEDDYVTVGAPSEALWMRLCRCLGLDHVLADPRYHTWELVLANQDALREIVAARFRTASTETWLARLIEAGVPAGRVLRGEAIFRHPQLEAAGMVASFAHPTAGSYRAMGFPLQLGASPAVFTRHAPGLGAHTREVLEELGYDARTIRTLVGKGVIRIEAVASAS